MNMDDITKYCSDLSASIRQKEQEVIHQIKEIISKAKEIEQNAKDKQALEHQKIDLQKRFEAEKNNQIEESVGVLMEVPDTCTQLTEMILNKSSLLVCVVCSEKPEESILVETPSGKQIRCAGCTENEDFKCEIGGKTDCSEYIERISDEIDVLTTIQKRIEAAKNKKIEELEKKIEEQARLLNEKSNRSVKLITMVVVIAVVIGGFYVAQLVKTRNIFKEENNFFEEEMNIVDQMHKKKVAELEQKVREQEIYNKKTVEVEQKLKEKLKEQEKVLLQKQQSEKENLATITDLTSSNSQKQALISNLNTELQSKSKYLTILVVIVNLITIAIAFGIYYVWRVMRTRDISKEENKSVLLARISEILDSENKPNSFRKYSIFRAYDNKIVVTETYEGKVTVQTRENQNERDDFVYWWNGMQFCLETNGIRFRFSVYFENVFISSVEVETIKKSLDRLIRRGNNIYLSIYKSDKLYKFEFEEDKLVLSLLGNVEGVALSLLEHENVVYVGTTAGKLFKIQNKTTEEVLKTKGMPTDIQITGDELKTVDNKGNCYIYSLSQNKVLKEISVGSTDNTRNFLTGEYIVKSEKEYLTVFDWEGKEIKKAKNPTGDKLFMLTRTEGNTVLSSFNNGIAVFNHSTLELAFHKGEGVIYLCINQ